MIYLTCGTRTRVCQDEAHAERAVMDGWRIVEYAAWQAQRRANEAQRFAELRAASGAITPAQPAEPPPSSDDGPHVELGANGKPWWY